MSEPMITINLATAGAVTAAGAGAESAPAPVVTEGPVRAGAGGESVAAATDAPPPDAAVGGTDLGSLGTTAKAEQAPAPDGATAHLGQVADARRGDDAPHPLTLEELAAVIDGGADG